jgi:hypothetical protein
MGERRERPFVMLSRMMCPDESVTPLRKSSCEHVWCNNALEKDGVGCRLGSFEHSRVKTPRKRRIKLSGGADQV